jgi:hypothetical protein
MFRMTAFALAAAATLAATAAAPTMASAADGWRGDRNRAHSSSRHHSWQGSHHNWQGSRWHNNWRNHNRSSFSIGFYAPYYAYAPRCYLSRRWVDTRWGWRLQRVRVCR